MEIITKENLKVQTEKWDGGATVSNIEYIYLSGIDLTDSIQFIRPLLHNVP